MRDLTNSPEVDDSAYEVPDEIPGFLKAVQVSQKQQIFQVLNISSKVKMQKEMKTFWKNLEHDFHPTGFEKWAGKNDQKYEVHQASFYHYVEVVWHLEMWTWHSSFQKWLILGLTD